MKKVELRDFLLGSLKGINKEMYVWQANGFLPTEHPESMKKEIEKRVRMISLLKMYKENEFKLCIEKSDELSITVLDSSIELGKGDYEDDIDVEETFRFVIGELLREIEMMFDKLYFWNTEVGQIGNDEKIEEIMNKIKEL